MKILMVNKFLYPNGGSETYMFKLGEYLTSLGHQVEYFGMEHPDRCVSNSAQCYTKNMDFHNSSPVEKILFSQKTIYSFEARKKIRVVLETFKPDVVHLNNINFQLTPSIIYEIKKHNIPIVQTVHDSQIACPNHRLYIEREGKVCNACKNGCYLNCLKNKCLDNSAMKSLIATIESYYYHSRKTYDLVDCYICPSKFMAQTISTGGIKENKITVLHNYCQKAVMPQNKKDYVIYFGRLSLEKGITTLIEVCKQLPQINFIFAGTGNLQSQCKKIKNINAVGFKSGNELTKLIQEAKLSVCPSQGYENCSMSIIESLSLGTPVIASNMGGNPELIIPNKTGLVFEAGNVKQLKNCVSDLYYSENLNEMSKNCVKFSTNNIENYSQELIKIYNSLIKG